MDYYDLKRLALILAVQAEIEGMKAENLIRERRDMALAYDEGAFQEKAMKLQDLAYTHNEQL